MIDESSVDPAKLDELGHSRDAHRRHDQQADSMGLLAKFDGDRAVATAYLVDQMRAMGLNAGSLTLRSPTNSNHNCPESLGKDHQSWKPRSLVHPRQDRIRFGPNEGDRKPKFWTSDVQF